MGLLDGLANLGLGHLEKAELVEEEKASVNSNKAVPQEKAEEEIVDATQKEKEYIYLKEMECPVCEKKFKQYIVKTGKARLKSQDSDLRPVYHSIDALKYDVVHCNTCGYAALKHYYGPLAKPHRDMLIEKIAVNYIPISESNEFVTYEDAFVRYQLALANAIVRKAKDSEKGLISLKFAWLIRGMIENYDAIENKEEYKLDELKALEDENLKNAMDEFIKARQSETPPIAGMNDTTLDYLLAVLCVRFDNEDDAIKLLADIIQSKTAGSAQKEKAREVLVEIRDRRKQKK